MPFVWLRANIILKFRYWKMDKRDDMRFWWQKWFYFIYVIYSRYPTVSQLKVLKCSFMTLPIFSKLLFKLCFIFNKNLAISPYSKIVFSTLYAIYQYEFEYLLHSYNKLVIRWVWLMITVCTFPLKVLQWNTGRYRAVSFHY